MKPIEAMTGEEMTREILDRLSIPLDELDCYKEDGVYKSYDRTFDLTTDPAALYAVKQVMRERGYRFNITELEDGIIVGCCKPGVCPAVTWSDPQDELTSTCREIVAALRKESEGELWVRINSRRY